MELMIYLYVYPCYMNSLFFPFFFPLSSKNIKDSIRPTSEVTFDRAFKKHLNSKAEETLTAKIKNDYAHFQRPFQNNQS